MRFQPQFAHSYLVENLRTYIYFRLVIVTGFLGLHESLRLAPRHEQEFVHCLLRRCTNLACYIILKPPDCRQGWQAHAITESGEQNEEASEAK